MDLHQLRYALAVLEHRHFSNAARALGVSQPTLSSQVAALEGDLGVRLFARNSHHVLPTAAGEEFLRTAQLAVERLDQARSDAERAARGDTGRIAVSFLGSAVYAVLPTVFREFKRLYPSVQIRPTERPTVEQATAVLAGQVDVGFIRPPLTGEQSQRLHLLPVAREWLVAAVPAEHPLAGRQSIPIAALSQEPLIIAPRSEEPASHDIVQRACHRAGFEPIAAAQASQLHTLFGLVAGGIGIAIGPASWNLVQFSGVVCKPLTPRTPMPNLTMMWRAGGTNAIIDNFIKLVVDMRQFSGSAG